MHDARGGPEGVWADGRRLAIDLVLPGRFNQANALLAAVAAEACGVAADAALAAMATVENVAGRFTVRSFGDVRARLCWPRTRPAGTSCSTW